MGLSIAGQAIGEKARGPLRVHPDNPHYFTDGSGKAVYLTGSHYWYNLQDGGPTDPPPVFDYTAYLDRTKASMSPSCSFRDGAGGKLG